VIITCSQCTTRFQLDESRIPEEGVKVRCSRCKHAFFVKRPDLEEASDRSAAESLARAAWEEAPAQERSHGEERSHGDGGGSAGADPRHEGRPAPALAEEEEERTALFGRMGDLHGQGAAEEESDWTFNEDPDEDPQEAAPLVARPTPAPAGTPANDPMSELFDAGEEAEEPSLEDLGRPEEWDLLGDDAETGAAEGSAPPEPSDEERAAAPFAAEAPARDPARDRSGSAQELPAATASGSRAEDPALELGAAEPSPSVWRHAGSRLAWAAVALLALWIAGASILGVRIQSPARPAATMVAGLRAEAVEAHFVENATAGFLLVVRGTLRNPGDSPRLADGPLRVRLLDAGGQTLAVAPVARRIPESALRLGELAALQSRFRSGGQELARTPFAPGEALAVAALFAEVPEGARVFRVEVARETVAESGDGARAALAR